MNGHDFILANTALTALPSGGLWFAEAQALIVSDLHLGKSERIARRGGLMLPPYETQDTLTRLETDIDACAAKTIICLGDSFDDLVAAESLTEGERLWITRLQAGRKWVWIEGNHDPGPVNFGGTHLAEIRLGALIFRHVADPGAHAEVSGHYHPKTTLRARGHSVTRACFLYDQSRVILPSYGTYTGGLRSDSQVLETLMGADARAILTGPTPQVVPMHRR